MYKDIGNKGIQLFTPRYWFADAATIEIGGEYGIFLDLSCFDTISKYKGIIGSRVESLRYWL